VKRTALVLKFAYCARRYLDDKRATLITIPDGTSILAHEKAGGDHYYLAGQYLFLSVCD
jgi:hypothetical protein